jgi:long-chain acyl-CoA synthetase
MTIWGMWEAALAERRPYPAFLAERGEGWTAIGWQDAARPVDELAAGFLSLGVERGERVAILSTTRLEWTLCDLALAGLGAVTVPVYPTSSAIECAYILGNAGARVIVCETADHVEKVVPLRNQEALDHIVGIEEASGGTVTFADLRARGRDLATNRPGALESARAATAPDDLLTILYTSGTTGPPKGCMLTHRHFRTMVEMLEQVPGLFTGADRVLLYLPLAHNFARLVQYGGIGIGFTVGFCADISRVSEALLGVRPTIFPSVPRLFEKVHAAVRARFEEETGQRRRLVHWALGVGSRAARLRASGRPVPRMLSAQTAIADRLVFSKVQARFGGELRIAVSGGAPLASEVAEFFHSLGILILEGYGLTECTTASHVNQPGRYRFGTVGLPLADVECRIAPDGEVLLRSPTVFSGYFGDERATRETFTDDGWLKTGDIGAIDSDGFLAITDRKKDIIITAGGKNVAPQKIENALKASPIVSQALVLGDRRPYVVALVSVDTAEAAKLGDGAEVRALVEQVVADVNATLARPEQLKRFSILEREFLPELGEVTPTLKLRRHVCEEHFRDVIEKLYRA